MYSYVHILWINQHAQSTQAHTRVMVNETNKAQILIKCFRLHSNIQYMGVNIIIVLPSNTTNLHCLYKNTTCFGPSDGPSSGTKNTYLKIKQ